MIVVGLTGAIATGKSEISKRFMHHGIPVFDADASVHALYRQPDVVAEIAARFPGSLSEGKVDRAKLSTHLVNVPEDFPDLEAIVHPKVRAAMMEFLETQRAANAVIAVVDVPLLLETGSRGLVDVIVVVGSDPVIQRVRALQRPGMTEDKLSAILARQLVQSKRAAQADYIVENSGSLNELHAKIDQLVYDLRLKAKERKS
jgi:dephospho-CoA kinase